MRGACMIIVTPTQLFLDEIDKMVQNSAQGDPGKYSVG